MMVFLSYSNQYSYNLYDIRYEYRVTLVKDTEYKARQPIYTKKYENRFVFNRHGIRIIVLQVGTIGNFDFQTLLINVRENVIRRLTQLTSLIIYRLCRALVC